MIVCGKPLEKLPARHHDGINFAPKQLLSREEFVNDLSKAAFSDHQ